MIARQEGLGPSNGIAIGAPSATESSEANTASVPEIRSSLKTSVSESGKASSGTFKSVASEVETRTQSQSFALEPSTSSPASTDLPSLGRHSEFGSIQVPIDKDLLSETALNSSAATLPTRIPSPPLANKAAENSLSSSTIISEDSLLVSKAAGTRSKTGRESSSTVTAIVSADRPLDASIASALDTATWISRILSDGTFNSAVPVVQPQTAHISAGTPSKPVATRLFDVPNDSETSSVSTSPSRETASSLPQSSTSSVMPATSIPPYSTRRSKALLQTAVATGSSSSGLGLSNVDGTTNVIFSTTFGSFFNTQSQVASTSPSDNLSFSQATAGRAGVDENSASTTVRQSIRKSTALASDRDKTSSPAYRSTSVTSSQNLGDSTSTSLESRTSLSESASSTKTSGNSATSAPTQPTISLESITSSAEGIGASLGLTSSVAAQSPDASATASVSTETSESQLSISESAEMQPPHSDSIESSQAAASASSRAASEAAAELGEQRGMQRFSAATGSAFQLPGRSYDVLPIGLGLVGGLALITMLVGSHFRNAEIHAENPLDRSSAL